MTTDTTRIELEVKIEAPPETVFPFLVDPARVVTWMGQHAALDPTPGGTFRVFIREGVVMLGEYVEVTPNSTVVFTFGWDAENNPISPGSTTVRFDLVPDGGGTLVRLTHTGLPADAVDDHTHGWQHYADRLAIAAPGGDPGPDSIAQG